MTLCADSNTKGRYGILKGVTFFKWGSVGDVYIPPKRDKSGKRFGFVRFKDVRKPKELEAKLCDIRLGTHRLRVNLPMFQHS